MADLILKQVKWDDLKKGREYLFKCGGLWMIGIFQHRNDDPSYLSTEDHCVFMQNITDDIIYELPE